MKTSYFLFIIVISSLSVTAIPDASYIEQKLGDTVDIVDESRKRGVEVEDLMTRLNDVIDDLDSCGWQDCSTIAIDDALDELDAIQADAIDRRRALSNELSISIFLFVLIISLYLTHRKYDIIHRFRWYLYRDREIKYE